MPRAIPMNCPSFETLVAAKAAQAPQDEVGGVFGLTLRSGGVADDTPSRRVGDLPFADMER